MNNPKGLIYSKNTLILAIIIGFFGLVNYILLLVNFPLSISTNMFFQYADIVGSIVLMFSIFFLINYIVSIEGANKYLRTSNILIISSLILNILGYFGILTLYMNMSGKWTELSFLTNLPLLRLSSLLLYGSILFVILHFLKK